MTVAEQRRVLLRVADLYQRRGTIAGLIEFIHLYTGVKAHVIEWARERRVWQLGVTSALGFDTALPSGAVDGIVVADPEILRSTQPPWGCSEPERVVVGHAIVGADRPAAREDFGAILFDDAANRITVMIPAGQAEDAAMRARIHEVVAAEIPAHVICDVSFIEPAMRIGMQARVGTRRRHRGCRCATAPQRSATRPGHPARRPGRARRGSGREFQRRATSPYRFRIGTRVGETNMSCCQSHSSARAMSTMKLDTPKRNNYYFSKLMDVLQFDMEQSYLNDKRWLLNRLSLGTGVLCGLNVKVSQGKLCVAPGVAIDTYGHEIIVPGTFCLDPWLLPDECGRPTRELPRDEAHRLTLCLAYRECLADQTPVLVTDCRSEQLCEAGTVVESFDLFLREGWPPPRRDFCRPLSGQGAPNNGYEIVATVPVGGTPVGVAVAADRMHALIANEQQLPVLQVLDLATNTVVHTFEDAVTAPIGGITIAPEGGRIFVTHARGIVAVDLQSSPPKLSALQTDSQYGPCAASHGGTRLHAINVKKRRSSSSTLQPPRSRR